MYLLQMKRDIKHEKDRKPNQTGIPSYMKQDFETRSGLSYDDVRVHYSSDKPAGLGALAYTQGTHVYIGPGQEKHLSHELVHVAQQKQGAVRPTGRLGNVSVNDDSELERQADRGIVVQRAQALSGSSSHIIQKKIGMEYQTVGGAPNVYVKEDGKDEEVNSVHGKFFFETDTHIKVTADGSDLEYVTPAVETAAAAKEAGENAKQVHLALKNDNVQHREGSRVYTFKDLGETAHPQATVGIRMDKISDLLTNLGGRNGGVEKNTDSSEGFGLGLTSSKLPDTALTLQAKIMREAPKEARRAVDDYLKGSDPKIKKAMKDYDSIVGLLSLLIAYNRQFSIIFNHPEAALNAKNAMPVMSRTSLYDIYCKLKTDTDREIFKGSLDIVKWDEMSAIYSRQFFGRTVLAGQYHGKRKGRPWEFVSLEKWKEGLDSGEDKMYNKFHSFGSLADPDGSHTKLGEEKLREETLRGFGIGRSTDIGMGDDIFGILAELRGLERGVHYDRWGKIAEQVAHLVNRLNGVPEPEAEPPAPAK